MVYAGTLFGVVATFGFYLPYTAWRSLTERRKERAGRT